MLESLRIKNVALIEESEISFEKGLNILSGETGAGKSMIIDSLNFALGERAGKDFLRKGEKSALVEALFTIEDKDFAEKLVESGIEPEEDGTVLIARTMSATGKAVSRVNGCIVTIGMLKELSEGLIDIHGQHEHQSLLNASRHIRLLDQFCGEVLEEKKQVFQNEYQKLKELEKDLAAILGDEQKRARTVDLLSFQTEEIENASLHMGEEEELLERRKILSNGEKILRLTKESLELLYDGTVEETAVSDKLAQALNYLRELAGIDESTAEIYERMESLSVQMDDCVRELKHYEEEINVDTDELDLVEERLQEIYGLKRKYGGSIEEILAFYNEAKKELDFLENSEETALRLEKEKEKVKNALNLLADEISTIRKEKARVVEKQIETQLKELEMKRAKFQISVEQKKEMTANGKDKVEFLISANAGEELKPLAKIASGGEMSRVMLALKTVLAQVLQKCTYYTEANAPVYPYQLSPLL